MRIHPVLEPENYISLVTQHEVPRLVDPVLVMTMIISKVLDMDTANFRKTGFRRSVAGAITTAAALLLAACGTSSGPQSSNASSAPACPTTPVNVVVTTNVWGSIVDQLVGTCANVSTVITNSAADPHDFEPTAQTSAAFAGAQLVVMNGLGYDEWAIKIVKSLGSSAPPVLNLGQALGLQTGVNPHIWYSPDYVTQSGKNVTAQMKVIDAGASDYFDGQAATFTDALAPYQQKVAGINSQFKGTKIGATETIFEYMAQATGLVITTPPGFIKAIATESEPSAKDVGTFREQLSNGTDEVLIYNRQTEGGLTSQMRTVAQANNVPVVDVTESLNPPDATFQAWQLAQLELLSSALTQSNRASANTASGEKYDRAVVLVSGLATQSPFTTPTQACRSGTPAGVSDSALRAGLLQANRNVFTAPTQIGSSQVTSAPGLGAFSDCPTALPTSMTINTVDRLDAGGTNLARFIEYLHQTYGVKDVDLVGHSMGGLFATAALSRLKAESSPVTVRSLSTLSAPWTGVFAADYAAGQLKTKACRSQPMCTKILTDYKQLATEEGPRGAAIQVTSQFLAGPTGWVARQKSALRDVPVTLIGGDYFRKSPGNAGVWPNDTLVALASAHATSVGDDVIPSRFCVTRPDVHTLNFAQELNLPDSSAITWDPEVVAAVNQAIARTDAPAAHPNRTGC